MVGHNLVDDIAQAGRNAYFHKSAQDRIMENATLTLKQKKRRIKPELESEILELERAMAKINSRLKQIKKRGYWHGKMWTPVSNRKAMW